MFWKKIHKWLKIQSKYNWKHIFLVLHKTNSRYILHKSLFTNQGIYCFEHMNIFTRSHADMRCHLQCLKRTSHLHVHLLCFGMTLFPLVATGMRSFRYSIGRYFSISIFTGMVSVTKPCLRKIWETSTGTW